MAHDPNSANQKQALIPKLGGMISNWKLKRKKRVPKVMSSGRQNSQNRIMARTQRNEMSGVGGASLVSRYKGYRKRKKQQSIQRQKSWKPPGGWKYSEKFLD